MLRATLVGTALFFLPDPALGATLVVNSQLDAVDATLGDGVCPTAGGVFTLRAAIQEANACARATPTSLESSGSP